MLKKIFSNISQTGLIVDDFVENFKCYLLVIKNDRNKREDLKVLRSQLFMGHPLVTFKGMTDFEKINMRKTNHSLCKLIPFTFIFCFCISSNSTSIDRFH